MVLVVPPVQMDVIGIDQQEAKQDEQDLQGVFAPVHKVSIKDVWLLRGWKAILGFGLSWSINCSISITNETRTDYVPNTL